MKFYANPYDTEATGFYFETYDEYEELRDELRNSSGLPVEEFMIDFIDGTSEECALVDAIGIDQCNLEEVIEYIDTSDEDEWPALFFLLDQNIADSLKDARHKVQDVCITESNLQEAATELFDDIYGPLIPDNIKDYIDYEAFARDCEIGGDMTEFEFGGKTYTCTNASGL